MQARTEKNRIRKARTMSRSRLTAFFGILATVMVATGGTVWANGFADCVRDAASKHLTAKRQYQGDLRELIVENRPEFQSLANVNMELQILLAEARQAMFEYLLAHDPDRIDTNNGVTRFSNFDWFDEDSTKLMEESGTYRELDSRISTLQEQNNSHRDWPKLREHFRNELSQTPEYRALAARLQTRQNEVAAAIALCRRD